MKPGFRIVKGPTSDVMFEAYGSDYAQLFENAALAVSSVMCEAAKVRAVKKIEVSVEGTDIQDLLFNWLGMVIAQVDIEGMFFSKFEVKEISAKRMTGVLIGDDAESARSLTVVKSVTYHNFKLEKTKDGYMTRVVLDI